MSLKYYIKQAGEEIFQPKEATPFNSAGKLRVERRIGFRPGQCQGAFYQTTTSVRRSNGSVRTGKFGFYGPVYQIGFRGLGRYPPNQRYGVFIHSRGSGNSLLDWLDIGEGTSTNPATAERQRFLGHTPIVRPDGLLDACGELQCITDIYSGDLILASFYGSPESCHEVIIPPGNREDDPEQNPNGQCKCCKNLLRIARKI